MRGYLKSISHVKRERSLFMDKIYEMNFKRLQRNIKGTKADEVMVSKLKAYAANMSESEIIGLLINSVLAVDSKLVVAETRLREKEQEIRLLNKEIEAIKDRVQLTAYQKNQCKMKAGRPIALKGKYSDVLALELQGLSDVEICQKLGISKTTLWRYRKQANEDKK